MGLIFLRGRNSFIFSCTVFPNTTFPYDTIITTKQQFTWNIIGTQNSLLFPQKSKAQYGQFKMTFKYLIWAKISILLLLFLVVIVVTIIVLLLPCSALLPTKPFVESLLQIKFAMFGLQYNCAMHKHVFYPPYICIEKQTPVQTCFHLYVKIMEFEMFSVSREQ